MTALCARSWHNLGSDLGRTSWFPFLTTTINIDAAGNVRIWDTVGEEQILKSEIKPISGRITDIAWDSESKRIIAVGEGKER
jgi:WD40 repeat protein